MCALSAAALAQTFEVRVALSPSGRQSCSTNPAITYAVSVSGDTATVTGAGITVNYKKIRDGVYQGEFKALVGTLTMADRSLRIDWASQGCVYEGKAK